MVAGAPFGGARTDSVAVATAWLRFARAAANFSRSASAPASRRTASGPAFARWPLSSRQWTASERAMDAGPSPQRLDALLGARNLRSKRALADVSSSASARRRASSSDEPSRSLAGDRHQRRGVLFISLPLSAVIRIDGVETSASDCFSSRWCLVWVGDTPAYFVGRWFGRMPMAPALSPKKTWEGAVANLSARCRGRCSFALAAI